MTYQVILLPAALRDLDGYVNYASKHSPMDAQRWLKRFYASVMTLNERPDRCPAAAEQGKVPVPLWEFHFGRRPNVYRVIFTIDTDTVHIVRVRRAQRRSLSTSELRTALPKSEGDPPSTQD